MRRCRRVVLASGLLLGACGQTDLSELQEFVERSGEEMRGRVEPGLVITAIEPVDYEGTGGRRQPFDAARVRLRDDPREVTGKRAR